ncbi:MAG: insulinase family protein [Odoribacteraceae bacterium]|jgi:predicted Zn-dependent peptidase|nr:insulinase family protein [Odoribacteraceae bacterium]
MIEYTRHLLDNGLTLLCHTDPGTSFVSVNTLYKVGARDEDPDHTGFAHLFEHLMFGGSRHVDDFDTRVQQAGGESNAYTNNDYTNYYTIVPAANIETALWLESDRMAGLNFSQRSLKVQKNVVIEEFKQHYLNRPYGDLWLHLRPLAYRVHPYRWNTIGVSPAHIERATLDEVKTFFRRHYAPDNAILAISGNIPDTRALELVKRWYGDIPPGAAPRDDYPQEPRQREARRRVVAEHAVPVPSDMLCLAFHVGRRSSDHFYACDILSDLFANGDSSRLYTCLVKERLLFSELDAYVTGDADPGLFVFHGKLSPGIPVEEAEKALLEEIDRLARDGLTERELQKVINKTDVRLSCSEINYQAKASHLAFFEYLGDAELVNTERARYSPFTPDELRDVARALFVPENSSTLLYLASSRHENKS